MLHVLCFSLDTHCERWAYFTTKQEKMQVKRGRRLALGPNSRVRSKWLASRPTLRPESYFFRLWLPQQEGTRPSLLRISMTLANQNAISLESRVFMPSPASYPCYSCRRPRNAIVDKPSCQTSSLFLTVSVPLSEPWCNQYSIFIYFVNS